MFGQLSAIERNVLTALAHRAGLAARLFDALAGLPYLSPQTASTLTAHAQLGVNEERGAQEVLSAAALAGLLAAVPGGVVPAGQPPEVFHRLALALYAIDHYKGVVHRDATRVRVVLTKPPSPCALEEHLSNLGWRTYDLEPTEHAFLRMVQQTKSRIVVMSPFVDLKGAFWLKELFTQVPSGVDRKLVLRSLEEPGRSDYPQGFDMLAPWLAAEQVQVFNYSLPRAPSPGRETFHAKVVLCDDDLAYVGSSNLTAASLEHSMEMGVAMEGKAARDVATVVEAVLQSATRMF
jgi:phosphatidylserine/phosphatidylglycerophosphate/cardiolipin synthase-like enzyme